MKYTEKELAKFFDEVNELHFDGSSYYMDIENMFFDGAYDAFTPELKNVFMHKFLCEPEFSDLHGGEGQGDDYWSVWKFDETYVKFYGYYASYHGSTYEGFKVVQPVEKLVTVFE